MALEKKIVGVVAHISTNEAGEVTHAWQDTTYAIVEDGVEKNRYTESNENLDPSVIASVMPKQADILRQLTDANARGNDLSAELTAAQSAIAELQGRVSQIGQLTQQFATAVAPLVAPAA